MKLLLLLFIPLLLIWCARSSPENWVVEIYGYQWNEQVVRGIGVCIEDGKILTSAHVVRDDRLTYRVWDVQLRIIQRIPQTDIAYMEITTKDRRDIPCQEGRIYRGKVGNLTLWQEIILPVVRSGSVIVMRGKITTLTGTILAYDGVGRTLVLTGMLMTDIPLELWDSWAPIFDKEGRVIDVVHVR